MFVLQKLFKIENFKDERWKEIEENFMTLPVASKTIHLWVARKD
jgi:hypothetical protein